MHCSAFLFRLTCSCQYCDTGFTCLLLMSVDLSTALSCVLLTLCPQLTFQLPNMATQMQQSFTRAPTTTKYNAAHPVCALGPEEISYASELIRSLWPEHTDLRFKTITLDEPPKALLLSYFQAEHEGRSLPPIDRKAFTSYYIRNTVRLGRCTNDW